MSKSLNSYFNNHSIVDIIAPASLCSVAEIKKSIEYVKYLGLKPRFNKNILVKPKGILCSQSLLQKKQELQKALWTEDSSIVWCLRGGYGSAKLLPFLSKLKKPKTKKLLIGYSDITALHYLLNQKWKWPSLHFSGLEELSTFFHKNKKHKPGYFKCLNLKKNKPVEYKNLKLLNTSSVSLFKEKRKNTYNLNSVIIGGNLCTLTSLLGSQVLKLNKISIPGTASILFLEELNEPAYKVDRMLYQLKEANYFKNIKAIVLGDFISAESEKKKVQKILKQFFETLSIPVVQGLKVGHGKINTPLAFMLPVNLSFSLKKIESKLSINLSYL